MDVLVDLVQGGPSRRRSAVLGFELRLAALRDRGLRAPTQGWTRASRVVPAPAHEEPGLLADDITEFFRDLRPPLPRARSTDVGEASRGVIE
ncbi:hypothetical protein ACGH7X_04015 [Streptomyces sp. BBFR51]|uniref:hypothetical protein n=1 Tax=Streptomyces sp. BBFR51 TaxID=3372856 RepID=UPI0037DCD085